MQKIFSNKPIAIAPLVLYRILFGAMLFYGGLSSIWKGDIHLRYCSPTFFFKYYGFEWLGYIGDEGIYVLYGIWLLSSLGILFGAFYRVCIWAFFFAFSYLHLLDATNYINHYYAISIFAFLLGILPANAAYALDVWRKPQLLQTQIQAWQIDIIKYQVAIIYIGAAIAKMNVDWVLGAMPLKIWLYQRQDFPVVGFLFGYNEVHYIMSWAGLLFDLTIIFWLWNKRTVKYAYGVVLVFHVLTGLLLNIGLFPVLMIVTTTVFLPLEWQQKALGLLSQNKNKVELIRLKANNGAWLRKLFYIHFIVQLLFPFRHYLYPGNAMWTEEGYRFAWWVMLTEKEGLATFYVQDKNSNRKWEVTNKDYLTAFQEKRMSIRPDHILQYAHYLQSVYAKKYELKEPIVTADVFVTMNGRMSQRLIDNTIDLTQQKRKLGHYEWILPYGK